MDMFAISYKIKKHILSYGQEKDALSSLFRIAYPYGISIVVCRGFNSTSFMNQFKNRVSYYGKERIVVLYFGDHDPSGKYMVEKDLPDRFLNRLKLDIKIKAIALNMNQTKNLTNNPESFKKKDKRAKWYIEKYGNQAWELDALDPARP